MNKCRKSGALCRTSYIFKILFFLFLSSFLLLPNRPAFSQEDIAFDFAIDFYDCGQAASFLKPEGKLSYLPADPFVMGCVKKSGRAICIYNFKSGGSGYGGANITVDTPSILEFQSDDYATYVRVNVKTGKSAIVVRTVKDEYVSSKVCHGNYLID